MAGQSPTQREGKYFSIKSKETGLVFEVPVPALDTFVAPGTPIYMWAQKSPDEGRDNQLWFVDEFNGVIRSRINYFCISLVNDLLVVNPFNSGAEGQQWKLHEDQIVSRGNGGSRILDVRHNVTAPGSRITTSTQQPNQHWIIEREPASYFLIQSELNGKVIDIEKENGNAGTHVVMWDKKDPHTGLPNQVWYEDKYGIIRSKLNDFAMDSTGGDITMQPYDPFNRNQQWTVSLTGDTMCNILDVREVIDIKYENKKRGANLVSWHYTGNKNQRWKFIPVGEPGTFGKKKNKTWFNIS